MVVNLRVPLATGLLMWGLLPVPAVLTAGAPAAHPAPEIPADAQAVPPSKSGSTTLRLTPQSPRLETAGETLPYALLRFHSQAGGSLRIESNAADTLLPPAAYLYTSDGKLLVALAFKDFEAKDAHFLKPDRLQSELSYTPFPNQTLSLLLVPAREALNGQTAFEHPANRMARAKSNAAVLDEKRIVPHSSYGRLTIQFKKADPVSAPAQPVAELPAENPEGIPAIVREDYRRQIRKASRQGDLDRVLQLKQEAEKQGVRIDSLNEFIGTSAAEDPASN